MSTVTPVSLYPTACHDPQAPDAPYVINLPCIVWDMLSHTCKDKDASRYAINGVLVESRADGLAVAATDGHRLAVWDGPPAKPAKDVDPPEFSIVIPAATLKGVTKPKPTERWAMLSVEPTGERDAKFTIEYPKGLIRGEGMDKNFPPYRDVMPDYRDDGYEQSTISTSIAIPPKHLADAGQLLHQFIRRHDVPGNTPGADWRHRFGNRPITLEVSDDADHRLTVVIMPTNGK